MNPKRTFLALASCMLAIYPLASQEPSPPKPILFARTETAQLVEVLPMDGTVYHVQGVDLDRDHVWITSVDSKNKKAYLHQFNRTTGKFERQVDLTDSSRYHPGGFSIQGNSIWIPVAEYTRKSSAVLVELDKHSLNVKRKILVGDHIGCLAVSGDALIGGNWDTRQLYVFDMKGTQLRVFDNPSRIGYQDIKYVDGDLVGSGNTADSAGSVEWFAWPSMEPTRTVRVGITDRGKPFTNEGMAVKGNDLYFVPEDGPTRLFHFVISTSP